MSYKNFVITLALCFSSSAQANVVMLSEIALETYWSTLKNSGAAMTPTAVTVPDVSNITVSTAEYAGIEYSDIGGSYTSEDDAFNGGSELTVSYASSAQSLQAESDYDEVSFASSGVAEKNAGGLAYYGRSFLFQAEETGIAKFAVEAALSGQLYSPLSPSASYSLGFMAYDYDQWETTYEQAINDGKEDETARNDADFAALLIKTANAGEKHCAEEQCIYSNELIEALIEFDVEQQGTYLLEVEGEVYVSSVPLPASLWMLMSGILGLQGFRMTRKKS